jgi:ABC-2 type transport system permease protein
MASQLASLTTLIPTTLLSGFIYPIFNMPKLIQLVSYLIPARYYNVILRELFLKGKGIENMVEETIFLLLFAMMMLTAAIRRFKKKVA